MCAKYIFMLSCKKMLGEDTIDNVDDCSLIYNVQKCNSFQMQQFFLKHFVCLFISDAAAIKKNTDTGVETCHCS